MGRPAKNKEIVSTKKAVVVAEENKPKKSVKTVVEDSPKISKSKKSVKTVKKAVVVEDSPKASPKTSKSKKSVKTVKKAIDSPKPKKAVSKTVKNKNKKVVSDNDVTSSSSNDNNDNNDNYDYDSIPERPPLIDSLFHHNYNGTLYRFLGDFLVNSYRKDNAQEQSMWCSDVYRATYIIREKEETGNKWNIDNGGEKLKKIIIDPLLEYITTEMNDYISKFLPKGDVPYDVLQELDKIKQSIKDNSLAVSVIKYMCPFFVIRDMVHNDDSDDF